MSIEHRSLIIKGIEYRFKYYNRTDRNSEHVSITHCCPTVIVYGLTTITITITVDVRCTVQFYETQLNLEDLQRFYSLSKCIAENGGCLSNKIASN